MSDIAELVRVLRRMPHDRWSNEVADALEAQVKRIAELERKLEIASSNAVGEFFISSMKIAQGLQSDDPETKAAAIEQLYAPLKPPEGE